MNGQTITEIHRVVTHFVVCPLCGDPVPINSCVRFTYVDGTTTAAASEPDAPATHECQPKETK